MIGLLAAGNASRRSGGRSHSHGVRLEFSQLQMLNGGRVCRRHREKYADGSVWTGEIELPSQPVLRYHGRRRAVIAYYFFQLLDLGTPLRDRRIDE